MSQMQKKAGEQGMSGHKKPDEKIARKVFSLRCKAKRGENISTPDLVFLSLMLDRFPEWYRSLNQKVFDETKPFGSV